MKNQQRRRPWEHFLTIFSTFIEIDTLENDFIQNNLKKSSDGEWDSGEFISNKCNNISFKYSFDLVTNRSSFIFEY